MPGPEDHQIRQAALDLVLDGPLTVPDPQEIADRADVPVESVTPLTSTPEVFFGFLRRPLLERIDDELKRLPIHTSPTYAQQRETLDKILLASEAHPRELALNQRLVFDKERQQDSRQVDAFARQSGLRLLGSGYDEDADKMTRVYLTAELITAAVLSRRHRLSDPHTRGVVLTSLQGVLNPPPPVETPRRRWTDST